MLPKGAWAKRLTAPPLRPKMAPREPAIMVQEGPDGTRDNPAWLPRRTSKSSGRARSDEVKGFSKPGGGGRSSTRAV
eukprot:2470378-Pyramimonas_sp.AAC.1